MLAERAVRDKDKVIEFRHVDLLVLRCNQKCRHCDKLQLSAHDLSLFEVAVNDIDREVQGLRHKVESQVYLDDPINKDSSHLLIDINLLAHVADSRQILLFFSLLHVPQNRTQVLSDLLHIILISPVDILTVHGLHLVHCHVLEVVDPLAYAHLL